MSSMNLFQTSGFKALSFNISVSTLAMKIFAKALGISRMLDRNYFQSFQKNHREAVENPFKFGHGTPNRRAETTYFRSARPA